VLAALLATATREPTAAIPAVAIPAPHLTAVPMLLPNVPPTFSAFWSVLCKLASAWSLFTNIDPNNLNNSI
jgi:hypothetical protein